MLPTDGRSLPVAADNFTSAAVTAGLTIAVVVAVGMIIAVVLIAKRVRSGRSRRESSAQELAVRAGAALLRADEALERAEQEIGYAVAQFGTDAAQPFQEALDAARDDVTTAFRVRQSIDETREPEVQRSSRHEEILALSKRAEDRLSAQRARFDDRRRQEVAAPDRIRALRDRIGSTSSSLEAARVAIADLATVFAVQQITDAVTALDHAATALTDAITFTDSVETSMAGSPVTAVSGHLSIAEGQLDRAAADVDVARGIDRDLRAAAANWTQSVERAQSDLDEARVARDQTTDPSHSAAIMAAIDAVRSALSSVGSGATPKDPTRSLDRLARATSDLDSALAAARNQEQRLHHARIALDGAFVTARSQISVARGLVGRGRGSLAARTRLAEAERQLSLAEVEADPVAALDTVRRAITHARDAEDLARYPG